MQDNAAGIAIDVVPASSGFAVLTPVIGYPEPGVFSLEAVASDSIQAWDIDFDPLNPEVFHHPRLYPFYGRPAEIWALEWPNGDICDLHIGRWFEDREELLMWWQNYIHDVWDLPRYLQKS